MIKITQPQKFKELPDVVLFDTDNTLYPYDEAHQGGIVAVQEKMSRKFSISKDEFENLFLKARTEVKKRLGNTASSHNRLLYFQKMLEMIGLGSQVLLALDFEQTYWRNFLSHAELFSGVKELLDDLRFLGIQTATVTDLTAQIQFRKIVYFGLDHYFDYIVTSEEAGVDKPHELPFQIALEKMNPGKKIIWMIGDHPINDIQGAREKIGAITLQKIHKGVSLGTNSSEPDCFFNDFSEVKKLLSQIGSNKVQQIESTLSDDKIFA